MKYATKKEINKRLYLPEDSRFVQEVIETANVKTDYPEDTTGMKNIKLVDLDSFSEALMEPVQLTRWVRKFLPDIRLLSQKAFRNLQGCHTADSYKTQSIVMMENLLQILIVGGLLILFQKKYGINI